MSADLKLIEGAGAAPGSEAALRRGLQQMARERGDEEISSELQARGIVTIEAAMARETSRGSRRWAAGAGVLVAAGAMMAFVFSSPQSDSVATLGEAAGTVELRTGDVGHWSSVATGQGFSGGTALRTGELSRASLSMDREITMTIAASSELRWPKDKLRVIDLEHGSVSFAVKDLQKGEFFVVNAGDTTVTVHGTEFSVTLLEENVAPCVIVSEGLVEVAGPNTKVWVSAGQETGCGLPEEPNDTDEAQEPDDAPTAGKPRMQAKRAKLPASAAKVESSSLAEQNKLFQKALVAERAGRLGEAQGHLDAFVAKYPDSPLGAQVRAQRESLKAKK